MYGQGISRSGETIDIGVDLDIIGKSGAWYSYGGSKIAQGRESAKNFLLDNPEVAAEIETKIKAKLLENQAEDEADAKASKDKKASKNGVEA